MAECYTDIIETTATTVAEAMLARESDWEGAESPDRRMYRLLMAIGLVALTKVLAGLGHRYEGAAKAEGFGVERRATVEWLTLFGLVGVASAYLRRPGDSVGRRPMRERLGIEGGGKSRAVERALTDFGIDESFGAAAAKFLEHYGVKVHRTTVRRTVLKLASKAHAFTAEKLALQPRQSNGPQQVLIEADGANAPLVLLEPIEGETTRTGRQKMKKTCTFREVRLGLAVPDGSEDPTYVAQVGDIARFAGTLAQAAQHRGAEEAETVYAVTDGGKGIRERIEVALVIDQYILDKRHCWTHLLATATAMEVEDPEAAAKVWMDSLAIGDVDRVLVGLDAWASIEELPGAERARQLRDHLTRFRDAVHYDDFVDRGLVVGSGEIESAHRHVTQRRLKIAGAWWTEENMNLIAELRCVRANGWWDEFCRAQAA